MKNIGLVIPFLKILFTRPSIVLKSLYHLVHNETARKYVENKYGKQNGLPELDLLDLFPGFSETVEPFSHLYGSSLPIDIGVLKQLARQRTGCEYLEIGTWRGESLANIASVAAHCVSVSLSDEEMGRLGWGPDFQRMQRFYSKHLPNTEHFAANSRTFDFHSIGRRFDLIFVDGDHSREGVRMDTEKVFDLLKNENSVIVWHDYVSQYEHINWEVLAGILDGTPPEKRSRLFHVSNSLCAIYLPQPLPSHERKYPAYPGKSFTVSITARPFRDQ